MAGGDPIFRQQAVAAHLRGGDQQGRAVRLDRWWLRWAFWVTLALVVAGAAAVVRSPAGQSSSGPAVVDSRSGQFAAMFPVAVAAELPGATRLDLILSGAGPRPVQIRTLRLRLATAAAARQAGLTPPAQPSILLTGRLPAPPPVLAGAVHASAVLRMPSRSLAAVLGGELRTMLGQDGSHA